MYRLATTRFVSPLPSAMTPTFGTAAAALRLGTSSTGARRTLSVNGIHNKDANALGGAATVSSSKGTTTPNAPQPPSPHSSSSASAATSSDTTASPAPPSSSSSSSSTSDVQAAPPPHSPPWPNNITDVSLTTGAPATLTMRTVKIYQPAQTAMQSGVDNTRFWKLVWDVQDRWQNPLIGWTSSGDYMQATSLRFRSKEEAIHFAERQGWQYDVEDPPPTHFVKKTYAANYTFVPGKLRIYHTK